MAYVYKHIRKDNNQPFYIGVGGLKKFDNYKRAFSKTVRDSARNKHWKNIVNLHDFTVEIISDNCTEKEAFIIEMYLIRWFGRSDLELGPLCNLTDGGEGNREMSSESREKISKAHKGKKVSKESIEKRVAQLRNRPLSEEHKRSISISNTGRKVTDEFRKKMSIINIGKHHSEETKKKLSEINTGKTLSYETRIKYSKKVIDSSTGIIYNCSRDVAEIFNLKPKVLRHRLNGNMINNTPFRYLN